MSRYRIDVLTAQARELTKLKGHTMRGLFERPDGPSWARGRCEFCGSEAIVDVAANAIYGKAVFERCLKTGAIGKPSEKKLRPAYSDIEPAFSE